MEWAFQYGIRQACLTFCGPQFWLSMNFGWEICRAGKYAGKLRATMGKLTGTNLTCGIFLRRHGEVLSDPEG